MTVSLKHVFASALGDGTDPSQIQPSHWNSEHTLTMASTRLLGRTSAGVGAAQEIIPGSRFLLAGSTLDFSAAAETLLTGALQKAGGAMTGDINMGGHKITALLNPPVLATDAATKAYADLRIAADGTTTVTADIPFNSHKLTGVATPTAGTDAANKTYADSVGVFAWARVTGGSTPNFSGTPKNFASVTRLGIGLYQLDFTVNFANTSYIPVVSRIYNASDFSTYYGHYIAVPYTAASIAIQFFDIPAAVAKDSFDFSVAVLGGV